MIKLNGEIVKPTMFPDNTSQVWKLGSITYPSMIEWRFENESEFIHLIQLYHLVKDVTGAGVSLKMPYLPYGRQDKQIDNLMTFALVPFLKTLRTMDWSSVIVYDPHSNVIKEYLSKVTIVNPTIDKLANGYDAVCFPDDGAANKYKTDKKVIRGHKVRNQQTGLIEKYSLDCVEDVLKVLVVDDICDGGATFVLLGEALQEKGVEADLYVSHGIFSKGVEHLLKYYGKITTTDSLVQKYPNLVEVLHV